jgi:glycosyltransferase involved in cell wall biosynthesis
MLFATQQLLRSGISDHVDWTFIDTTQPKYPRPSLIERAWIAGRRIWSFFRAARAREHDAAWIFSGARLSFIEKGLMAMVGRLYDLPVFLNIRGGEMIKNLEDFPLLRLYFPLAIRAAHRVVVQSRSWCEFYRSRSGASDEHFIVLPNWIDPAPYIEAGRSRKEPEGALEVLYLGRVEDYKGIEDLVDAVAARPEVQDSCFFHICGGSSDLERYRRYASRKGVGNYFAFHGWVTGKAKFEMLARAHALVLPSHTEGMPNAPLEAMAAGLAVIATRVGGSPELLDDGKVGILVDPHRPDQLGEALVSLVRFPDRRRELGAAAQRHVLKEHAVEQVVRRFRDIFSDLPPSGKSDITRRGEG